MEKNDNNQKYIKYNILPAFWEENNEGWIWINKNESVNSHDCVSITRKDNGKKLYTMARIIDNNLRSRWSEKHNNNSLPGNPIIISEYYRSRLSLQLESDIELCIVKIKYQWLYKIIVFACYHPNDVVKISTWLGIISIILGAISMLIAFFK